MKYKHLIILTSILVISLALIFWAWGFHNLLTYRVDIHLHDTYYVMKSWHALLLLFSALSLVFYLFRQLTKLFRDPTGNWIVFVFCLFFIWVFWQTGKSLNAAELELLSQEADFLTEAQLASKPGNSVNLMFRVGLTLLAALCIGINLTAILRKRSAKEVR